MFLFHKIVLVIIIVQLSLTGYAEVLNQPRLTDPPIKNELIAECDKKHSDSITDRIQCKKDVCNKIYSASVQKNNICLADDVSRSETNRIAQDSEVGKLMRPYEVLSILKTIVAVSAVFSYIFAMGLQCPSYAKKFNAILGLGEVVGQFIVIYLTNRKLIDLKKRWHSQIDKNTSIPNAPEDFNDSFLNGLHFFIDREEITLSHTKSLIALWSSLAGLSSLAIALFVSEFFHNPGANAPCPNVMSPLPVTGSVNSPIMRPFCLPKILENLTFPSAWADSMIDEDRYQEEINYFQETQKLSYTPVIFKFLGASVLPIFMILINKYSTIAQKFFATYANRYKANIVAISLLTIKIGLLVGCIIILKKELDLLRDRRKKMVDLGCDYIVKMNLPINKSTFWQKECKSEEQKSAKIISLFIEDLSARSEGIKGQWDIEPFCIKKSGDHDIDCQCLKNRSCMDLRAPRLSFISEKDQSLVLSSGSAWQKGQLPLGDLPSESLIASSANILSDVKRYYLQNSKGKNIPPLDRVFLDLNTGLKEVNNYFISTLSKESKSVDEVILPSEILQKIKSYQEKKIDWTDLSTMNNWVSMDSREEIDGTSTDDISDIVGDMFNKGSIEKNSKRNIWEIVSHRYRVQTW